uniref:Uncharacterized protein n=1 Tax=Oryza sativa subsp. japonica TaxID=39947 RepID=Q6EUN1_ORYSJ|nr:hypothetical protein [Oryza sativa Japonica Group]
MDDRSIDTPLAHARGDGKQASQRHRQAACQPSSADGRPVTHRAPTTTGPHTVSPTCPPPRHRGQLGHIHPVFLPLHLRHDKCTGEEQHSQQDFGLCTSVCSIWSFLYLQPKLDEDYTLFKLLNGPALPLPDSFRGSKTPWRRHLRDRGNQASIGYLARTYRAFWQVRSRFAVLPDPEHLRTQVFGRAGLNSIHQSTCKGRHYSSRSDRTDMSD